MTAFPTKTRSLTVFYFDDDFEGGRIGSECAFAHGIDADGEIWSTIDDCEGFSRKISSFESSNIRFARNKHMSIDDPIFEQILAGKQLSDWRAGEMCYAGCGNFGICFGVVSVPVVLEYEATGTGI